MSLSRLPRKRKARMKQDKETQGKKHFWMKSQEQRIGEFFHAKRGVKFTDTAEYISYRASLPTI